jgi:hypothetical protein
MKRKVLSAIAAAILAFSFRSAIQARGGAPGLHEKEITKVILRVRFAFETQPDCRNLFSNYGGDPRPTLNRARFSYVGNALDSAGFAAATAVGTSETFIGAGFYQNLADRDGMATVLIHELLHQQGAGKEIDNYVENYRQIANACRTRNAAL